MSTHSALADSPFRSAKVSMASCTSPLRLWPENSKYIERLIKGYHIVIYCVQYAYLELMASTPPHCSPPGSRASLNARNLQGESGG